MTARMEKVRNALVRRYNPTHPALVAALAEVEEWEARMTEARALLTEAAKLAARAEAAEAAAADWKRMVDDLQRDDEWKQAEADRLKAALKAVVDYFDCLQPDECGGRIGTCRVCSARAALAPADRNTT